MPTSDTTTVPPTEPVARALALVLAEQRRLRRELDELRAALVPVPAAPSRSDTDRPEVRLLGPVELLVGDEPLALDGRQARIVLATLAAAAGSTIGIDRLVDALWGDAPPASAAASLHTIISRMRAAVRRGAPGLEIVARRGDGYGLALTDEHVDAVRFERLVRRARTEDDRRAVATYDDALALWRGPALADVAGSIVLLPIAARLDGLRLVALEERAEAQLRLGAGGALVPHLRQLVDEHPFHERFVALLMTALYRSGRQAEALREGASVRRRLADQLGLDPGPELVALERAVLDHDPAL